MSDAYHLFMTHAKNYGWSDYREGIGYKNKLLTVMTDEEIIEILHWVKAKKNLDWPEAELLDCIDSDESTKNITELYKRANVRFKMHALETLHKRKVIGDEYIESEILEAIKETTILKGMTDVIRMIIKFKSEKIKRAVLFNSVYGNPDIRVHFAALSHFLYGFTNEDFDLSKRDFYLRFNNPLYLRKEAFSVLCKDIGINEKDILG